MKRRIKFPEPVAVTMRRNRAYMDAMVDPAHRERFERDFPETKLPALLKNNVARQMPLGATQGNDNPRLSSSAADTPPHSALEADVIRAVSQLLATHPKVLIAIRMNSGMASSQTSNGRMQPIWFHKFLRSPCAMKMPDFIGMMTDGRPLALEAKRGNWKQPSDERERKQAAYLYCIRNIGGIGEFVTSADQAANFLVTNTRTTKDA